jgi:putative transposase
MPYLPRYHIIFDDAFFHVTWQCHNRDWLLRWDWAKELYYDLLLKYKDKYGIQIYSYCFMDNHPHLSGKLGNKEEFSAFFRIVNSMFARIVNKRLKRRGQLVMDRFKSPQIQDDEHLLTVMAYIDLNPYRAGKVEHPRANKWSSFSYYAYGGEDKLLTPAPSYLALAEKDASRQKIYREMVGELMLYKRHLDISHTYFIGNPEWVIKKYTELKTALKSNQDKNGPAPPG